MTLRSHKKKENESSLNKKNDNKKVKERGKNKDSDTQAKKVDFENKNKNIEKVKSKNIKKEEYENNEDESEYELNDSDNGNYFEIKNTENQKTSRKRKRTSKNDEYQKAIKKECEINLEKFSTNTPQLAIKVRQKLYQEIIPEKKRVLMTYFKTGPGEYADGDQFYGIPVPGIRSSLKEFPNIDFESLFWLITSSYHEERMLAALYMTEISKKIQKEEKKKKLSNNQKPYQVIFDNINDDFKKYKCHTIPELIKCFIRENNSRPGEREGWDVVDTLSANKRHEEKRERIGESRPVLLDQVSKDNSVNIDLTYQFHSNLGFTDPLKIQKQILFEFYIECMPWIDNWDLVDLTCRDIIGSFIMELEEDQIKTILYSWLAFKISDQVVGYKNLQNRQKDKIMRNAKIRKEIKKENKQSTDISIENLSINTVWTKRVAIICTFYFINNSDFRYTIFLLEKLLNFEDEEIYGPDSHNSIVNKNRNKLHDLIEKASGWMLREIGKRDGSCSGKGCKCILKESKIKNETKTKTKIKRDANGKNKITTTIPFNLYTNERQTLIHFLNKYAWKMPRIMLRYSIEKLPVSLRTTYLNAKESLE
jgi:3-methyladenine DNA glycosylase AlkD